MANAFKLSPIVQTFGQKSNERTKSFKVTNTTNEEIILEVEAKRRFIDINNVETRADTDDFLVYPPQMKVAVGKTQTLRVSYVGKPVTKEEAYRLIVRQIPNKLKKKPVGKTQINFLFEYVASLYISPGKTKPNLEVSQALKISGGIEIKFENVGSEHVLLRKYKIEVSQGSKKKTLSFKSKKYEKLGSQNILAGLKRKIFIPDVSDFEVGKVKVKFLKIKD